MVEDEEVGGSEWSPGLLEDLNLGLGWVVECVEL